MKNSESLKKNMDFQNVYKGNPLVALSSLSPASVIMVDCGASSILKPNLVVTWIDGTGRERLSLYGAKRSGELIEYMVE